MGTITQLPRPRRPTPLSAQKQLRDRLKGEVLLDQIAKLHQRLEAATVPVHSLDAAARVTPYREMDQLDLARTKAQLDSCFKLLNKVLPDLKAVDMTLSDKTEPRHLSDLEMATRLTAIMGSAAQAQALTGALDWQDGQGEDEDQPEGLDGLEWPEGVPSWV